MGVKVLAVDGGAAKAESTKDLGAEKYIDFNYPRKGSRGCGKGRHEWRR
jgi:D-arabinose 1-dehydrogenase-like Zn-dependent alcohol dehydrogenase